MNKYVGRSKYLLFVISAITQVKLGIFIIIKEFSVYQKVTVIREIFSTLFLLRWRNGELLIMAADGWWDLTRSLKG